MKTLTEPTKTKAIKDHVCDFCGLKIGKGTHYMRSSHIADEVYTWKAHEDCDHIAHRLKMYDNCDRHEGLTGEDFSEEITGEYMLLMKKKHPEGYQVFKSELERVPWKHCLGTVIRHYKQLDKQIKK